ncbi:M23 family metallopeptidase [Modestobacter sp. SYSU DS0290]
MTSRHVGSVVEGTRRTVAEVVAEVAPDTAERRAVRPGAVQSRRPAALVAALAIGGLVAFLGSHALPTAEAEPVEVAAMLASDASLIDEEAALMPQSSISEVEARARLEEVAAARAERQAREEEAAAAAAAAAEAARPKVVAPIAKYRLTSCFCQRWGTMHWGVDLAAPMLTPEYSVEDGVVLRAGAASGYGLAVYILGESGDVTVYGHMEKIQVRAGDVVEAGDQIALLGNRGQSTGPHLHFEVHSGGLDGKRVDPVKWLAARGVDL